MFNWVDVIIAIILIYNLFKGFTKGFVRSIAGLLGYFVCIVIAKIYYKSVAIYISTEYKWFLDLKTSISNRIISSFSSSSSSGQLASEGSDPLVLNSLNLPSNIKGDFLGFFTELRGMKSGVSSAERFADYFSSFILNGLAFLLIFLVCLIIIMLAAKILDSFVKLPLFKQVNQLSGILFGGIKGCLIVYLIMTVVVFTSPIMSATALMDGIRTSILGDFFYNYNIFLFIIDNIVAGDLSSILFG